LSALDAALADPDPLASFDLDALLEGAARLRGDRTGFEDRRESVGFAEADARASALAAFLADLGLVPGETVLLGCAAPATAFVAVLAAIRAGLHIALAPAFADEQAACRMALLSSAAALLVTGDGDAGSDAVVRDWLPVAAAAPSVRLLCSIGAEKRDGMVSFDPRSDAGARIRTAAHPQAHDAQIVTFEDGVPIAHVQRTLVAAALDVVARSRIGMRLPILSTIAPSSFAGLVAGPLASLLAGAPLHWRTPFEASQFLEELDRRAPVHLVAPAPIAPMLERAGLVDRSNLAALVLLSRQRASTGEPPPAPIQMRRDAPALVDLYAFGERAAVAEMRISGAPVGPASEPHYLDLDGTPLLAVGWSEGEDGRRLRGVAVTSQ